MSEQLHSRPKWLVGLLTLVIVSGCVHQVATHSIRIINLGKANRANSFPKGQCTWYAFERTIESGNRLRFGQGYGRHAKFWPMLTVKSRISQTPTKGSIMVLDGWQGNPYGHVAYVESVQGKNKWTISHANTGIGNVFAKLDGVQIRKTGCQRITEGHIAFPGSEASYKLIGFLTS